MRRDSTSWAAVVMMTILLCPVVADAQYEVWETEETRGELGANVQLFGALLDLRNLEEFRELEPLAPGYGQLPSGARFGGGVGRVEWFGEFGDRVTLEVHNRFVWERTTIRPEIEGMALPGLEVSAGQDRRVDTEYDLVEGEQFGLTHDIDRLVASIYLDAFDLYVGRQAIRWGVSELFPVADRFAPLSPFELDTIQRRGIDAGRMVAMPLPDWELDVVIADRGEDEPVSFGAKAEYFGVDFQTYIGGGRFWERVSAMGGVSWLTDEWKFFAEGEALWNLDEEEMDRPRVTAGVQRMAIDGQFGVEYHYNGFGIGFRDDYLEAMDLRELQRGETYYLGQHYLGMQANHFLEPEFSIGGGAMLNVVDPSVVLFPTARYELTDRISVGAGAYIGLGEQPQVDLDALEPGGDEEDVVTFPTEYGANSDLYYLQMTAFF